MSVQPFNEPGAELHSDPEVAAWLSKSAADLRIAGRELAVHDPPNLDAVCFHAQQAAEKLLKAAIVAHRQRPPKVHDLVHLGTLLRRIVPRWSFPVDELSDLSSLAVDARYPGFESTPEQAAEAFRIALRVWIELRPLV
jgi:HEPN domain-containing protein